MSILQVLSGVLRLVFKSNIYTKNTANLCIKDSCNCLFLDILENNCRNICRFA